MPDSIWTDSPPEREGWYYARWEDPQEPSGWAVTITYHHEPFSHPEDCDQYGPRIPAPEKLAALEKCAEALRAWELGYPDPFHKLRAAALSALDAARETEDEE